MNAIAPVDKLLEQDHNFGISLTFAPQVTGSHDPDTVLFDVDDPRYEVRMSASEWMEDYAIDAEGIFPLAVLATGDQVRAARQALREAAE